MNNVLLCCCDIGGMVCQCILLTESSRPRACSAFVWLPKTKKGVHFYGFLKICLSYE